MYPISNANVMLVWQRLTVSRVCEVRARPRLQEPSDPPEIFSVVQPGVVLLLTAAVLWVSEERRSGERRQLSALGDLWQTAVPRPLREVAHRGGGAQIRTLDSMLSLWCLCLTHSTWLCTLLATGNTYPVHSVFATHCQPPPPLAGKPSPAWQGIRRRADPGNGLWDEVSGPGE